MLAIDTNILVRLIAQDDAAQAQRAAALFEHSPIFVSKTVLLETAWVLRFSYALPQKLILKALKTTAGLPQVTVEDSTAVAGAFALVESGMDFADALHLASSRGATEFATFDQRMKKRADAAGTRERPVVLI